MLEEIKTFCEVVKQHSLVKAAEKLGMSPPMVTRHLQQLEAELKVQLLHRTTRCINVTEAGDLFYQQALEILIHFDAGKRAVESVSEQVVGTLKIGVPTSIAQLWLVPALKYFYKQFPDVTVDIISGNHLINVITSGFDIVIHCGTLPDSSFYSRKIRDWKKIICASPTYFKKYGKPKHPQDLEQHHCLDHSDNRFNTWGFMINGKHEEVFVNGPIKSSSSIDLKNLSVEGLGLVYLPDFTVLHDIKAKKLVSVLDQFQPTPLGLYAIYPSKQYLSQKTKVMLDFMTELLK